MAETSKILFDCLNADNLRDAESTLMQGGNPNFILPVEGVAPIHLAAGLGYEATRLLLQYGGDPNIRSAEGSTPLHVAATWGDRECLQLLLQNGGDPFIQDQEGNNVLQTSKIYQHEDCFNLLESYILLLTPDDMYQPEIIYQCRNPIDSFDDTLEKEQFRRPVRRKTILNSDYLDDYLDKALRDKDRSSGSYASEIQRHIDQLIRSTRHVSLDVTSPEHPFLDTKSSQQNRARESESHEDEPSLHVHWADKTLPLHSSSRKNTTPKNLNRNYSASLQTSESNNEYSSLITPENMIHSPRNTPDIVIQSPRSTLDIVTRGYSDLNTSGNSLTSDDTYLTCTSTGDNKITNTQQLPAKKSTSAGSEVSCENCHRLQSTKHIKGIDSYNKVRNYLLTSELPRNVSKKVRCERNNNNSFTNKLERWKPPVRTVDDEFSILTDDDSFFIRKEEEFQKEEHKLQKQHSYESTSLSLSTHDNLQQKQSYDPSNPSMSTLVMEPAEFSDQDSTILIDLKDIANSNTGNRDTYFSTNLNKNNTIPYDAEMSLNNFRQSTGSIDNDKNLVDSSDILNLSFYKRDSFDSDATVEYIYKDPEKGVTLIEKRLPSECGSRRSSLESQLSCLTAGSANTDTTIIYDWKENFEKLNNCEIHEKLKILGDDPGPVTASTRQTYLSRLRRMSQDPSVVTLKLTTSLPDYPQELRLALEGKFEDMDEMEAKMVSGFQNPNKNRRWREGTLKSSFNYLLLDPRVTCNLPNRISTLGDVEGFKVFVEATFYVGKGKRSRPYCHLYEAISAMKKNTKTSEKVQRIIDIWQEGLGVVSLHCFQSVIPVEAYTREACMVDAMGLQHLTNKKRGDYYGVSTTWTLKQKQKIGVHLLRKCFKIFLQEGERQLCIGDVK